MAADDEHCKLRNSIPVVRTCQGGNACQGFHLRCTRTNSVTRSLRTLAHNIDRLKTRSVVNCTPQVRVQVGGQTSLQPHHCEAPCLFIGGGIGVAPLVSMWNHWAEEWHSRAERDGPQSSNSSIRATMLYTGARPALPCLCDRLPRQLGMFALPTFHPGTRQVAGHLYLACSVTVMYLFRSSHCARAFCTHGCCGYLGTSVGCRLASLHVTRPQSAAGLTNCPVAFENWLLKLRVITGRIIGHI